MIREEWEQKDKKHGRPGWFIRLLRRLALWAPLGAHIITGDGGSPYLLRVYFTPRWWPNFMPRLFLHHFFRGDEDREYHNHPWARSWSLILTEGYLEDVWDREKGVATERTHRPGQIVSIDAAHLHRVQLYYGHGPWTLFVCWNRNNLPMEESWGFYDPKTDTFTPWKLFLDSRGRM